ncbi:hypothetical protein RvY_18091-3 [Ramazzottius varieornatus]|uniref:Receptor ligand binding region domain-containing protein n=1 Tax=Ramazzottius varieornatus TaxID=947166 RepID=A0A1D1W4I3_RAMVA|nr:hypothetical protein RvY_18091-3 [Ramazzottius varieornatus]
MFLLDFTKRHGWINIVLIYDSDSNDIATETQSLRSLLKERGMMVYDTPINATHFDNFDSVPTVLRDGSRNGRVFIILLSGQLFRYFLTTAYRIGMGDGEFVFISLDLFHEQVLGSLASWQQRDGYDDEAKKAYSHLLVLSLKNTSSSATHQQFVKDVHSSIDARRRYNEAAPPLYPTVNYYMGKDIWSCVKKDTRVR